MHLRAPGAVTGLLIAIHLKSARGTHTIVHRKNLRFLNIALELRIAVLETNRVTGTIAKSLLPHNGSGPSTYEVDYVFSGAIGLKRSIFLRDF